MSKILGQEQIKENVQYDYVNMIKKSWTYGKLTEKERNKLIEMIYSKRTENCLKGTYKQRWEILQIIYESFLMGLNYEPIGWREDTEEIPLF